MKLKPLLLFKTTLLLLLILNFHLNAQTVTINCTGTSGSYKSGSVTSAGVVTDGNMLVSNGTGTPRGWAVFNIASLGIPSNANITTVSYRINKIAAAGGANTPTCTVYGIAGDESVNSGAGATLYSHLNTGTVLSTAVFGNAAGSNTLTLNAASLTFIQNNLNAVITLGMTVTTSTRVFNISGYNGTAAEQPQLSITYTVPCSGTPPVATATGPTATCPSKSFTLTATGASTNTGISYQWESSPAGANTWTPISGATAVSYTVNAGITAATDYHFVTTCSNGGLTSTSNIAAVAINPPGFCFCASTSTSSSDEFISKITVGTFINTTTRSNYASYVSLGAIDTVQAGTSFSINVAVNSAYDADSVYVYLDGNQDGTITNADIIGRASFDGVGSGVNGNRNVICTVPASAITGLSGLRIKMGDATSTVAATNNPCQASFTFGEVEDYILRIDPLPSCLPPTTLTVSNVTASSANLNFTASSSAPAAGYDYYVSTDATDPVSTTNPTGNGAGSPIAVTSGLNPGTDYNVWVRARCSSSDQSAWTIAATFTTLLLNDDASGAVTVTLGAGCTGNPYSNIGATKGATEPFPSCKGANGFAGVWFKFIAPASGAVRVSCDGTGATIGNTKMALYSALDANDYTSFTIISCDDDNGVLAANKSLFYTAGLTSGQTYYVQVDLTGNGQARGTFCLTIDELAADMLSTTAGDCVGDQASIVSYVTSYQGWISLVDADGKLNANVRQLSGTAATFASSRTIKAGASRTDAAGLAYMNRNFLISGAGATSADVQLFFTDAELTNLGAAIGSLNVSRVPGSTCNVEFAGTATTLVQTTNGSANGANFIQVNTPGFSNFYIMSGTTPLPLKLVSFKGENKGDVNKLTWTTAREKNFSHFELQRSADGINYDKIDIIKGKNVESGSSYVYTDLHPSANKNFYRLLLMDKDGQSFTSDVVEVNTKSATGISFTVHPNPVKDLLQINISGKPEGKATVQILDVIGRIIKTQTIANNYLSVDMSGLHSGTYFVKYIDDRNALVTKVIKD